MGGRSYGQSLKWKYLTEQTALYAHSKGNQLFLNKIPTPPHTPSVHKSTSTKPITKEPRNSLILCSIKNSIKIIKKNPNRTPIFCFRDGEEIEREWVGLGGTVSDQMLRDGGRWGYWLDHIVDSAWVMQQLCHLGHDRVLCQIASFVL